MPAKTCQYGNCLEDVGPGGVTVSLKTPTSGGEVRAIYCCATHAALSVLRLAIDRKEKHAQVIQQQIEEFVPSRWRVT